MQRAVEAGAEETGVSVAYTVLEMDAGPVLAAERAPVPPDATSAELLDALFARGADLLLGALPDACQRCPRGVTKIFGAEYT